MRENLARRDELGAAVTVVLGGRVVVDLWCGWADEAHSCPWQDDTLVNVFSTGKALAATCLLMLVSRGRLDLDQPVCRYWPQFAQEGKETVTVRQVLSHQAGLAAIERELPDGSLYDWDRVTAALAQQRPWWAPGSGHGYHVHTFGFLVGEIVRRVAGEPVGRFLDREIAQPRGIEVSFGLPAGERKRRAQYVFDFQRADAPNERRTPVDARLRQLAYLNPPGATGIGTVNTAAWQDADLPSANLHASARGVAAFYGELLDGLPLLDGEVLAEAVTQAAAGDDLVLGRPSRFGLGFQLTQPERPFGPNPCSFGHFGTGGSVGFADPRAGLAFAYVMNRGGPQWKDPRNRALIEAVYASLE